VIDDAVRLSRAPRQNGVRPAADPLFRSAALYAGPRVTAVVLSGTLDDAALGSATVERRGGRVVVQDPDEADYEGMPRSAIAATREPVVAAASRLAGVVIRLAKQEEAAPPGDQEPDPELAAEVSGLLAGSFETDVSSRTFSDLTCPDCGGPLYLSHGERMQTYDCLVGHRWTPKSLLEQHSSSVERAIWVTIRSLEERVRLSSRLADSARARGHALSAGQFAMAATEAKRSADTLRAAVNGMTTQVAGEPEGGVS
jgi:two-component system chemotaxis response regulator CheB